MTWVAVGATVVSAGVGLYTANQQAKAGQQAAAAGERANQAALAQQGQLTRQQLELNRPLIQTRDAALNQLNEFFGLPPVQSSDPSGAGMRGTNGTRLVALPGVTTTGQHGKQTNTDHNPLNPLNNIGGGMLSTTVRPGASGGSLFYDPGANAIVDGDGNLISQVPEGGGVVPGLLHGFNNQVAVDANGNVTSVGHHGSQALGIRLQPGSGAAATPAAAGTGMSDFSNILKLPIFQFQRNQGESVINRNLAQREKFFSGQRGAALLNFNNALVANRIGEDFVNPRLNLINAGSGASSNAQNALIGQSTNVGNAASNTADFAADAGAARSSGYAGAANAVGQATQNLLTLRGQQQQTRRNPSGIYLPTVPRRTG